MTRIVPITTHARTGTLEIDERNDRVFLALTFDKYGDFGDLAEITKQLAREIIRFDGDGRPLIMRNPPRGGTAVSKQVEKWVELGNVAVDSGTIAICDPCCVDTTDLQVRIATGDGLYRVSGRLGLLRLGSGKPFEALVEVRLQLVPAWGEEVEPAAGAAERLTLMARVLPRALTAGNSSLDYAPPLAKITAHFLQREHP